MTGTLGDAWLILGASSSVARAFARQVGRGGADLVLAGRDLEDMERTAADLRVRTGRTVEVMAFDATDTGAHAAFADAVAARCGGRLDVFLAFGLMPAQEDMDRDPALVRAIIDTNVTGTFSILAQLARVLEARRRGTLMVLGSVAGDRGRRRNYVYGATKAALHTYLQGLRARLFHAGVRVVTVKPGVLDTAMTWGLPKLPLMATPEAFARAAAKQAAASRREVVYIPAVWGLVMLILRAVPERLFKRTNI